MEEIGVSFQLISLIVAIVAIFVGVVNVLMLYIFSRMSNDINNLWKTVRTNKKEADDRRERDLTEMRDKFESLKDLINKRLQNG